MGRGAGMMAASAAQLLFGRRQLGTAPTLSRRLSTDTLGWNRRCCVADDEYFDASALLPANWPYGQLHDGWWSSEPVEQSVVERLRIVATGPRWQRPNVANPLQYHLALDPLERRGLIVQAFLDNHRARPEVVLIPVTIDARAVTRVPVPLTTVIDTFNRCNGEGFGVERGTPNTPWKKLTRIGFHRAFLDHGYTVAARV